jgi:hypothetical protein
VDTLIADAPTPFAKACEAIRTKRCLELIYDGHRRVVEAHVAGTTHNGEALLRAWQVRGGSSSGRFVGWKMFRLAHVESVRLTAEHSQAPREGYRRDDPAIVRIVCQV